MTTPLYDGIPIKLLQFRDCAAVGVTSWGTLLTLVPDPLKWERTNPRLMDRRLSEQAELRNAVQRVLKGTQKGKNVRSYANYIAAALRGDLGRAYSTPPICLWSPRPIQMINDGLASIPLGSPVIAVDGETQLAAMHAIMNSPHEFGLDIEEIPTLSVPFEIYWDVTVSDARQIFHDRNLFGVPVAKTLALSMDQRDFGTTIAQQVIDTTKVEIDGKPESIAKYVNTRKRQLGKMDPEWITLSSLRSLAVTTLLGKAGIEATSKTIDPQEISSGIPEELVLSEISEILSDTISRLAHKFAERSAITAPAVLAGVGAAAHRTTSLAKEQPRLTREQFATLLSEVRWEREARYWEGVAAKRTSSGGLSFAGGAKDSGHRVCDAILNPDSELGMRIRGRSSL
ncbi:DNA sulfur modification protein DndB [Streptosporangium sp. NPDC051022]|uniref:DNA sulfur modification protein DndB n=1 Tax=Streptosporangium sp. NPDC051022 TaxID=3155752 RepID=UPI003426A708